MPPDLYAKATAPPPPLDPTIQILRLLARILSPLLGLGLLLVLVGGVLAILRGEQSAPVYGMVATIAAGLALAGFTAFHHALRSYRSELILWICNLVYAGFWLGQVLMTAWRFLSREIGYGPVPWEGIAVALTATSFCLLMVVASGLLAQHTWVQMKRCREPWGEGAPLQIPDEL